MSPVAGSRTKPKPKLLNPELTTPNLVNSSLSPKPLTSIGPSRPSEASRAFPGERRCSSCRPRECQLKGGGSRACCSACMLLGGPVKPSEQLFLNVMLLKPIRGKSTEVRSERFTVFGRYARRRCPRTPSTQSLNFKPAGFGLRARLR